MKAAKPLHIVLATNPNPTRTQGYPLNINPKPDSISGPAGSGPVADLYTGAVSQAEGWITWRSHLEAAYILKTGLFQLTEYIHES